MRLAPALALGLDTAWVVGFAVAGRASHAEAVTLAGVAGTAAPFLLGLGVGWALVRGRSGRWPLRPVPGAAVWALTVAAGVAVRAGTGQGTDPAFVVVAAAVLGAGLVGWRAAARVLRRPGRPTSARRWSGPPRGPRGTSGRPR